MSRVNDNQSSNESKGSLMVGDVAYIKDLKECVAEIISKRTALTDDGNQYINENQPKFNKLIKQWEQAVNNDKNTPATKISFTRKLNSELEKHLPKLYKMLLERVYTLQELNKNNPNKTNETYIKELYKQAQIIKEISNKIHLFQEWSFVALRQIRNDKHKTSEIDFHAARIKALDYMVNTKTNDSISQLTDSNGEVLETNEKFYRTVMDQEGNLFVHPNEQLYKGGLDLKGNLLFAGSMKVNNGKITAIDINEADQLTPEACARFLFEIDQRQCANKNCVVNYPSAEFGTNVLSQLNSLSIGPDYPLKEKPNPKNLKNALLDINKYLRKRSQESNWLTAKFGEYSGKDYFIRQEFFTEILGAMADGKKTSDIVKSIEEKLPKFNVGFRKEFANHLKELIKVLEQNPGVLDTKIAQEVIKANHLIHEKQYRHKVAFDAKKGDQHKTKADYADHSNRLKNTVRDLRNEFADEEEMDKSVQNNLNKF